MTLLELQSVRVRYGSAVAVAGVSMEVPAGRLVGLIGPNGAGKTSLLDALTGFTPVADGHVVFRGDDVTSATPHRRSRLGIARTWQAIELFDELTVGQNVALAARDVSWWAAATDLVRPRRLAAPEAATDALTAMGLDAVADALPTEIPTGTRNLVGVARALATTPSLLLLDEPAAGLAAPEAELLGARLRTIVDRGVAVVLVDHDVRLLMSICDEIAVLNFGELIAHGKPDDVRNAPSVIEAYLGATIDAGAST
jgi:branched-chain amino acid transport system ATP-binding protein